jgi:hypothetical protein
VGAGGVILAVKLVVAVLFFVAVLRMGVWALRLIAQPAPPPPPAGELRKINVRYRCSLCGMEMRVVLAPDEEPEPPRHCMEDMEIVVRDV